MMMVHVMVVVIMISSIMIMSIGSLAVDGDGENPEIYHGETKYCKGL